jgi:hypothetical protein
MLYVYYLIALLWVACCVLCVFCCSLFCCSVVLLFCCSVVVIVLGYRSASDSNGITVTITTQECTQDFTTNVELERL